jgi:hypothetical protein
MPTDVKYKISPGDIFKVFKKKREGIAPGRHFIVLSREGVDYKIACFWMFGDDWGNARDFFITGGEIANIAEYVGNLRQFVDMPGLPHEFLLPEMELDKKR